MRRTKNKLGIFIVEDDKMQAVALERNIRNVLSEEEAVINIYETGETCLLDIQRLNPKIVFLDYYLNSKYYDAVNGLEVLKQIKRINKDIEVVVLSGQNKLEIATGFLKNGAYHYISKNSFAFEKAVAILRQLYYGINKSREKKKDKLFSRLLLGLIALLIIISLFIANIYARM